MKTLTLTNKPISTPQSILHLHSRGMLYTLPLIQYMTQGWVQSDLVSVQETLNTSHFSCLMTLDSSLREGTVERDNSLRLWCRLMTPDPFRRKINAEIDSPLRLYVRLMCWLMIPDSKKCNAWWNRTPRLQGRFWSIPFYTGRYKLTLSKLQDGYKQPSIEQPRIKLCQRIRNFRGSQNEFCARVSKDRNSKHYLPFRNVLGSLTGA